MKKISKYILLIVFCLFLVGCEKHVHNFQKTIVDATCISGGYTLYRCECGYQKIEDVIRSPGHKKVVIKGSPSTCTEKGKTDKIICSVCNEVLIDHQEINETGHVYTEFKVVKEATENEEGLMEKECTICHNKVTQTINKLVHNHVYTREVVAPLCMEQGYTIYTCRCGDTYNSDFSNSLGHIYGEYRVTKEPTEDEPGIRERKCERCNKNEYQTIPPLNHTHDYQKIVTVATCNTVGSIKFECPCGDYFEEIIPATGHIYQENKIYKYPTEQEEGIMENICSKCKHVQISLIPKLEHTHEYNETVYLPSCTEKGYSKYECACGNSYIGKETELLPHEYNKTIVPSTCTEKGYTEYTCSCGHTYRGDYTSLSKHVYGEWKILKEATEEQTGQREKECIYCDNKVKEEIAKLPHTHEYLGIVIPATCTKKGYTNYICECGSIFKDNEVPTIPHQYNKETINPTCTEKGYTKYTCSCGYTYNSDYTQLSKHVYGEWKILKEATEEQTGQREKECIYCDNKVKEEIAKLPHTHKYLGYVIPATCTEKGYTKYVCECGSIFKDNEVPTIPHQYSKETINPTCTEKGYTKYTCSCGYTYNSDYTQLSKHVYGEWKILKEATEEQVGQKEKECIYCDNKVKEEIAKLPHTHKYLGYVIPATCTEKGYTEYRCLCGSKYKADETPITPHQYNKETINPTCTEKGYIKYTCDCGHTYNDNYIDAKGHKYTEYKVIKEPTEKETGLKEQTCLICDFVNKETIPVVPHTHKYIGVVIAPTCLEKGYTVYICECNYTYNDDYVEKLDHDFEDVKVVLEPTCETPGMKQCVCKICGTVSNEEIPTSKAHDGEIVLVVTPSTCSDEGEAVYKCTKCNANYLGIIEKSDNHVPVIVAVVKEATCTVAGAAKTKCEKCEKDLGYTPIEKAHKPFLVDVLKQPTCTEVGLGKYVCEYCVEDLGYIEMPKVHKYGELVIETNPTPNSNGKAVQICEQCGHSQVIVLIYKEEKN